MEMCVHNMKSSTKHISSPEKVTKENLGGPLFPSVALISLSRMVNLFSSSEARMYSTGMESAWIL